MVRVRSVVGYASSTSLRELRQILGCEIRGFTSAAVDATHSYLAESG